MSNQKERYYDLDWIRILALLSVFTYHTTMFFNLWGWHAKNNDVSAGITVFSSFVDQYIMPLFFAVSGISTYYALQHRRSGAFVKERVNRLVIPLVLGIFVLSPHQVYIERVIHGQFKGSLAQFFPHYFEGFYGFGGNFAWMGLHLWYVLILFLFSMIMLPIFASFKKNGISFVGLLLSVIPLFCFQAFLSPKGLGANDFGGWNLFIYLSYFVYGYYLFSNTRFREILQQYRMFFFTGAIITSVSYLIVSPLGYFPPFGTLSYVGVCALRVSCGWFLMMAIFQLGQMYLNKNNASLQFWNQAVMPFYVLHQPVLVGIAFFLYNRSWGIPLKFVVLYIGSFAVIMFIYYLIVRPVPPLRFVFGMKYKQGSNQHQTQSERSMPR